MTPVVAENPVLTDSLLYLDGVNVSFDGYKALRGLSLILAPGEMRAIIGPNGAGKTTMMDVITGKTRPDDGDVFFEGKFFHRKQFPRPNPNSLKLFFQFLDKPRS